MTETTTTATESSDAVAENSYPTNPADILMNLIVACLAPMFLTASGGNIEFARMAALETINAYRAHSNADLIAVAQVIACGLAALGSLSLSMADDISLSLTLRLRGNANALMRSAGQIRRTVRDSRPDNPAEAPFDPGPDPYEAAVIASVAETRKRVDETRIRQQNPEPPAAQPSVPAGKAAAPAETDEQLNAIWAAAMTRVAGEFTTSLPGLPPAERKMASLRAAALSSCANDLLSGKIPPRLRPGALDALIRPNAP